MSTEALFLSAPTPRVIVTGFSTEVNLCCAKIAAKAGCDAFTVVPNERDLWRSRALMYGRSFADGEETSKGKRASAVSGVDGIARALSTAEAAIVACDNVSGAPSDRALAALFDNAPKLKHVAMLSTLGGGLPNSPLAKSLAPAEATIRRLAESDKKNIEVSIIRVGVLKGGGPGEMVTSGPDAGKSLSDFGLDKFYYNTLVDLSQATGTMAYDRFCVSADVLKGDPLAMPNPLIAAFTSGSFEAKPTECSRSAAASALVAAIRRNKGQEFTLSAKAATELPSPAQWITMLDNAL